MTDSMIRWTHMLIYQAKSMLQMVGIAKDDDRPTEMAALTLAVAYGIQWSLLLPDIVTITFGMAYMVSPSGFWKGIHWASDWMAGHSRNKKDEIDSSADETVDTDTSSGETRKEGRDITAKEASESDN